MAPIPSRANSLGAMSQMIDHVIKQNGWNFTTTGWRFTLMAEPCQWAPYPPRVRYRVGLEDWSNGRERPEVHGPWYIPWSTPRETVLAMLKAAWMDTRAGGSDGPKPANR